jgi:hypothetical protein
MCKRRETMRKVYVGVLIIFFCAISGAQSRMYWDACGWLTGTFEPSTCYIFVPDGGGEYALDSHGDFKRGDRVHVIGSTNPLWFVWCGTWAYPLMVVDTIFWDSNCMFCIGIRGNVDYDQLQQVNIADVTYLVDYLFRSGPPPPCFEEGDVNGSGTINVADVTYLSAYLKQKPPGSPPPPACP